MVVINGEAINAGSNPSFLAAMGNRQPNDLAINTTKRMVRPMTTATAIFCYWMAMRIPLTTPRITPQINATLISFHQNFNTSRVSISPVAKPRMINVDA